MNDDRPIDANNDAFTLGDVLAAVPRKPGGHIDNEITPRVRALLALGLNLTLADISELNGLVARSVGLAKQRPPPSGGAFPTGGAPVVMAA